MNDFKNTKMILFNKKIKYECLNKDKCKANIEDNKKIYKNKKFIGSKRVKKKGMRGYSIMPIWRNN